MSWHAYVKQQRKNESGPVALINLGKAVEVKFGYRQYIKLFRDLCKCDAKAAGTKQVDFDSAVRLIFGWMGEVDMHVNPTPPEVYKAITAEHGVVIKFRSPADLDQYAVVQKIYNSSSDVYMVNFSKRETTSRVDRKSVESILQSGATMWTVKSKL